MPLHKTLYSYAFSILGDENDAEDCLQESYTKLWENRSRLEKVENIAAYATVTVKNIALSMVTRTKMRTSPFGENPPEVADSSPSPGLITEEKEDLRIVGELLRTLPENQRKVVMMSAIGGLTNPEITEATGLSDDNVRVLLSRGRKRLRQLFSQKMK